MFISMIFDLATLAIAFMAFTSTATAQQSENGQVNIYYSNNCQDDSLYVVINGSSAGSAENNCNSACTIVVPDGETSMQIFNTNANQEINQTTCYFFFDTSKAPFSFKCPPAGAGGNTGGFQRSDQGCQVIPSNLIGDSSDLLPRYQPVAISCYTGEC